MKTIEICSRQTEFSTLWSLYEKGFTNVRKHHSIERKKKSYKSYAIR